jgi:phage terminase large subunit-like protein
MKLISWNVNGIRAALNKGLADFLSAENPDILCLQETKAREEQVELPLEFGAYKSFWNSAEKPGYSGTVIFTKEAPLAVSHGFGIEHHDKEGRVITLEYPDFHLVNVYTVNAQDGLRRLPYRLEWDTAFRKHLNALNERYRIKKLAIDRWNAVQLATQLEAQDSFDVVAFGQGMASMSAPTKRLEELLLEGRIVHGGHPVLRWNAANVSVETDAAGNLKPSKKKSLEKIDGIVATIMGLALATSDPRPVSVYESKGIVTI